MASLGPGAVEGRWSFKEWRCRIWTALALGVLAFILAQWPPIHRAGVADLETVSMGPDLVVAGAVPWFLQCGCLAMLFTLLMEHMGYLDRRTAIVVVVFPLAVGSCWWIGIAATHWGDDPLEFVVNSTMWSMSRGFGAETLAQSVLFEVLGPLMCLMMLGGPYVLSGWSFLWTALSTSLVMLLLAWTAQKLTNMKHRRLSSYRSLAFVGAVALIYNFPVFLRGLFRVVGIFQAFD